MRLVIWPFYELRKKWLSQTLTAKEGIIMLALFARPEVQTDDLVDMLWSRPWMQPKTRDVCIRGTIEHLRRKLKPFGYMIVNRRNFGYRLVDKA